MNITTLGIDLAKTSCYIASINQQRKVVLRKTLKRAQPSSFIVRCTVSLIDIEACRQKMINIHWISIKTTSRKNLFYEKTHKPAITQQQSEASLLHA